MTGCASAGDDAANEGSYGTVAMSLTGQTNGTTYRLRNALFEIAGPSSTLLDSELISTQPCSQPRYRPAHTPLLCRAAGFCSVWTLTDFR